MWFIKKGRVDTLSRTPFAIGHEVVVCDHKHVMLADFYDGVCPTCHSAITVAFSRGAVEYPKPPRARGEFLKWFFPAQLLRRILPRVNAALGWILGATIVALVILNATGAISQELFLYKAERTLIPRTELLFYQIGEFAFSNQVGERLAGAADIIAAKNEALLVRSTAVLSALGAGLLTLLINLWDGLRILAGRLGEFLDNVGL